MVVRALARLPLSIEPLESRIVPAGNILATFAGGVLTLTAESAGAAEHIRIEMVDPAGDFPLSGQVVVSRTDGDTTVNNIAGFITPAGQTVRSIKLDLKGGDDDLEISGVQIPGSLTAILGEGNNSVFIDGDTSIGGALSLKSGVGNDSFDLVNGVRVAKNLTVSAGAGTNDIDLLFGVHVGGALAVSTGAGNDTVRFGRLFVGGATTAKLGDGENSLRNDVSDAGRTHLQGAAKFFFGADEDVFDLAEETFFGAGLTANLGNGFNLVELEEFTIGGKLVSITGGFGGDIVRVADSNINGSLKVALGGGQNSFSMDDVTEHPLADPLNAIVSTVGTTIFGNLTITSGNAGDRIEIGDERPVRIFGATQILTGDELGGDVVQIDDTSFYGSFLLNAGLGTDLISLDGKTSNYGTVLFGASMKILAGDGSDFLRLGTANTTQSGVYFVIKPILDGGLGATDKFVGEDYFFGGVNAPLGQIGWET